MTISEYADKIVNLISSRPPEIDLDRLLYEIHVRAKISEARSDRKKQNWTPNDKVMEKMWTRINSKSDGFGQISHHFRIR